jgi:hypothetical protein
MLMAMGFKSRAGNRSSPILARARIATALPVALVITLVASSPVTAADRDGDGLRDKFETNWGLTDPDRRDSDRDGVVDSAEDLDDDRLGNLGEQRFGTDPGSPDSDGDGTLDGDEDDDGDGRSNALQQDQRPIPRGLRPTLAGSRDDIPKGKARCLSKEGRSTIRRCTFGDKTSSTKVVLFGDSHANHWLPAFDRAGKNGGWRIITIAKGGCRSVGEEGEAHARSSCAKWRRNALRWLRQHPPDVVVLSNSAPKQDTAENWYKFVTDTLAALPTRSAAVVLSDTPRPGGEMALCLRAHRDDMSACAFRRVAEQDRPIVAADRAAAEAAGAIHRSLFDQVCTYDPCPLVQDDRLIYRGVHHLTATMARQLAPSVRDLIEEALAPPAAVSAETPVDSSPGDVAPLEEAATAQDDPADEEEDAS